MSISKHHLSTIIYLLKSTAVDPDGSTSFTKNVAGISAILNTLEDSNQSNATSDERMILRGLEKISDEANSLVLQDDGPDLFTDEKYISHPAWSNIRVVSRKLLDDLLSAP